MRLIDADAFLKSEIERCGCVPLIGSCTSDNEVFKFILEKQPTVEAIPKSKLDEIVERLKKVKMRYFLTIANTGDDKLDFAYEKIGNALDDAIEIVREAGGMNVDF